MKRNILILIFVLLLLFLISLVNAEIYTPHPYTFVNGTLGHNYIYAPDVYTNINGTLNDDFGPTSPPPDTCTYSSGNWDVDCSDNCVITSPVNVAGNNIYISGTGTFTTQVDISNYGVLDIRGTDESNICKVTCKGGCFR